MRFKNKCPNENVKKMMEILLKKLELLNLESNKNGNLQDNVTFFSNID